MKVTTLGLGPRMDRDLGWIKVYACLTCGRQFWQRPELVDPEHRCVTCRRRENPDAV